MDNKITPTHETASKAEETLDLREQYRSLLERLDALEQRRISQSSIPPQTVKSRHLESNIILDSPSIDNLVAYANNAAAIAAGLEVGKLYRIGDTVAVVH